jgi:dCMP deaminase
MIVDWNDITKEKERLKKWDQRFLGMAKHISGFSKDPSTQVGAIIVRPDLTIVSMGYNGFARGVKDHPDRYTNRDIKYEMVIHAEINAIISAKEDISGFTLFTYPFLPCSRCAAIVIQSGIKHVVTLNTDLSKKAMNFELTLSQFQEAGLSYTQYPVSFLDTHLVP